MNIFAYILKKAGWQFIVEGELPKRCVVCVAPHTTNWDFILGELCIRSVGMRAGFLMKDTWFFFPLGLILKSIGGIPVSRKRRNNVTSSVVETFKRKDNLMVAVTPEGTRSRNANWHKGFLYIAHEAKVPIVMGVIDYKRRKVIIEHQFNTTGNFDADLAEVKQYFSSKTDAARYPDKFVVDDE